MSGFRVVAIDWSGNARAPEKKTWLAIVDDNALVDVRRGARPRELATHLVELARDCQLIVGLDFAFSFPAWFVRERIGATRVEDVWEAAERFGEGWLATCEPPFWGRPQKKRPPLDPARPYFRLTEERVPFQAKSVFQIGGHGAVGAGSIRGMPLLKYLREAGFQIWPFHSASLEDAPLVIEIYPRLLTREVVKSSAEARRAYVERGGCIPSGLVDVVTADEDPFDAAISALEMAARATEIAALVREPEYAVEGAIWQPGWSPSAVRAEDGRSAAD